MDTPQILEINVYFQLLFIIVPKLTPTLIKLIILLKIN